jgi:hypothetical protein
MNNFSLANGGGASIRLYRDRRGVCMDYEEEYEEIELVKVCEDCDRLQQQVYERTMRLREAEFGSELQQERAKRLLDAAVQEQLRHQREHDLEEELPEDC